LFEHVAKGGVIEDEVAFAGHLLRCARSALRRQCARLREVAEDAPARERPSFDEVVTGRDCTSDLLRGATQQKIRDEIVAGSSCEVLAKVLGQEVREVRRQVLRLARTITGRADSASELPRSDTLLVAAR